MKIPLNSPARKQLLVALAVVFAGAYLSLVAVEFIASLLGSRATLTSLQRAAWLDPGNADYRNHVGRYYDLVARDPITAVGHYKAAVELNPHSARYWFDLASAYQVLGDTANQTAALEHAIKADSMTPDVAWEAANLYLVQGQNEKALREFRVVMANDPSLAAVAMTYCWRINPDVENLLSRVVPPTADAGLAFLTLLQKDVNILQTAGLMLREALSPKISSDHRSELLNQADTLLRGLALPIPDAGDPTLRLLAFDPRMKMETAATFKVWDALMQSNQPFEKRYAYDYIKFLIQRKEVDQAVLAWQQITSHFDLTPYLPSSENLVVNANFRLDVLNNGFDWQYEKQLGVNLLLESLDPSRPPDEPARIGFFARIFGRLAGPFRDAPAVRPPVHGPRSLVITFDGPRINDAGFYQLVPVQPNTRYEFSAQYQNKGEQEGAGGPHFTITDFYNPLADYYQSDELKGADFWKPVDGEFTTGPDCKLVILHFARIPKGSPIRGKLWVDDFRIVRKPS